MELRISAAESEIASSQEKLPTQADIGKDTSSFVESLSENIGDVVDVTIEMEELGIKDPDLIEKTAENAENAPITKQNVEKAKEVGVEDTDALAGFVANPDKSDEAAEILADAEAPMRQIQKLSVLSVEASMWLTKWLKQNKVEPMLILFLWRSRPQILKSKLLNRKK